jgi:hypothetical protein
VVEVPKCPAGQIYDATLGRCVPTLDPFGCAEKCEQYDKASAAWAQCLFQCNASGGRSTTVPGVVGPVPPPPPVEPAPPTPFDVLGKNLPLILAAMGIGLVAMVYFANREKPKPRTVPNRKRTKKNRRPKRRPAKRRMRVVR